MDTISKKIMNCDSVTYWYECDECEDSEPCKEIIKDGWACECGGSMYLRKTDRYRKAASVTHCMTCANARTECCIDCSWKCPDSVAPTSEDMITALQRRVHDLEEQLLHYRIAENKMSGGA